MLRTVALRSARLVHPRGSSSAHLVRFSSTTPLNEVLYTAESSASGSRAAGVAENKQTGLSLNLAMPKEMGGSGKPDTHNPEELFGAGYAACYLSAMNAVHGQQHEGAKPLPKSTTVDACVSIGKTDVPGFHLSVELKIHKAPLEEVGLSEAQMHKLAEAAHDMCPYSRAIKGNVPVKLTLV
ncbi:hypothetical protein JCM10212_001582 [Sporobolomyces blumeae]